MTADLAEFLKLSKPHKRTVCPFAVAAGGLAKKERVELEAACATDCGVITNAAISAWLKRRGSDVAWQSIATHRRHACPCARSDG